MDEYRELMESTGFNGAPLMTFTNEVTGSIKASPDRIPAMFRSLANGEDESFIKQAMALGLSPDQARYAVRDTAALASVIIQCGGLDACW